LPEVLSPRYVEAFEYVADLHAGDTRKGGDVPYLAHLMAVSALVLDHGGDETQAIAGLLHDAAEDHGGRARLDEIGRRFGGAVRDIVELCSDSLVADRDQKPPWWPRKVAYIARFETAPHDSPALVVAAADKLHNARALLSDYREVGEDIWRRFNRTSGRAGQLWYYGRLAAVLGERLEGDRRADALARELGRTVVAVRNEVVASGTDLDTLERELELARTQERELLVNGSAG
jgi:(p)ppGpp synthase/HD superfamily hydrolase